MGNQKTNPTATSKKVLFLSVTLLLGFGGTEIASFFVMKYAVKHPYFASPIPKNDRQLRIFTNDSGILPWGIKKNFEQKFSRRDFQTTIKTNNVGFREETDYYGDKIDIGFIGDSFTFGYGVNHGERYSDVLRHYFPDKNIVNYSYSCGFSPPHYYLFLKNNPTYIPEILVLGLFPYNDLLDDIENARFSFDDRGELKAAKSDVVVNGDGALERAENSNMITGVLKKFNFGRLILIAKNRITKITTIADNNRPEDFYFGQLSETNFQGLEYVRKLNDFLAEHHSRTIVFIIPRYFLIGEFRDDYPFDKEIIQDLQKNKYSQKLVYNWLKDHDVEAIEPTDSFQKRASIGEELFLKIDRHWNANGHKLAAEILADYIKSTSNRMQISSR